MPAERLPQRATRSPAGADPSTTGANLTVVVRVSPDVAVGAGGTILEK